MDTVGLLRICMLFNTATAGHKPVEQLELLGTAYYEQRRAGITRIYAAMGADRQFDMIVRCFNTDVPREGLYVIIEGEQFRIDICQKIIGQDAVDLTLVKVENYYDVKPEGGITT